MIAAAILAASLLSGEATAVDGDTLRLGTIRVRIFGIDAPESHQRCSLKSGADYACGERAALFLAGAVYGRSIVCEAKDRDRYGRTVALCRAGGVDLGQALVNSGLAVADRRYSEIYVADEERPRRARRGLWSGAFVPPSDFRANRFR